MSEWQYCIKECTYVKTCTKDVNTDVTETLKCLNMM